MDCRDQGPKAYPSMYRYCSICKFVEEDYYIRSTKPDWVSSPTIKTAKLYVSTTEERL